MAAWVRAVLSSILGVALIVGGIRLMFGSCESLTIVGSGRPSLACDQSGDGEISPTAAGLLLVGVGAIVIALVSRVLVLEFRQDRSPRRRRSRRRPTG